MPALQWVGHTMGNSKGNNLHASRALAWGKPRVNCCSDMNNNSSRLWLAMLAFCANWSRYHTIIISSGDHMYACEARASIIIIILFLIKLMIKLAVYCINLQLNGAAADNYSCINVYKLGDCMATLDTRLLPWQSILSG